MKMVCLFRQARSLATRVLAPILLASCGGGGDGGGGGSTKLSCPPPATAQQALALVNAARSVARMCGEKAFSATAALSWHTQLEAAASAHSADMVTRNFFAHTNPDGVTASQRTAAAGYGPMTGENLAAGHGSMEQAMQSWLASAGHCENIMNPSYRHYAIACASRSDTAYGAYWTQTFGVNPR